MKPINSNIESLLHEFKDDVQKLYGDQFVSLILFGSYSRGQEHENSDIDLLVVLKSMQSPYTEIRKMSDIKYNILDKYEIVLSTVPTTKERFDKLEVPLYRIIQKEGVVI